MEVKKMLCRMIVFLMIFVQGYCESDDLYNSKAATSDLQWIANPANGKWEEVSGFDVGLSKTIRYYQVCAYSNPNPNNWVRTPFISSRGAEIAYIDVEFSMMKCDNLESSCKETFNLYYFESDRDDASSTFPPWRENPYIKIDTIAGERFSTSDRDVNEGINFKTWSIGPLTKNGFYIAAQDKGACMSLLSIRVYYFYCPRTVDALALFPRTVAGKDVASLEEVDGECVKNSNSSDFQAPRYYCNSNGQWIVRTGACHCKPGYQANHLMTKCEECDSGHYKSSHGNQLCSQCPAHSTSARKKMTTTDEPSKEEMDSVFNHCFCEAGYYRTPDEDVHAPCTKPPSKPVAVRPYGVNSSSVTLGWSNPNDDGGRNDLYFNVTCLQCLRLSEREVSSKADCFPCSNDVIFQPSNIKRILGNHLVASNLTPFTTYRFKVYSMNQVTPVSDVAPEYDVVTVTTEETVPSAVVNVQSYALGSRNVSLKWSIPLYENGAITKYQVVWTDITSPFNKDEKESGKLPMMLETKDISASLTDLKPGHDYSVRVRAATSVGFGPYSRPVTFRIVHSDPADLQKKESAPVGLMVGVVVGIVLIVAVVAGLLYFYNRRKWVERERMSEESTLDEKEKLSVEATNLIVSLPPTDRDHRIYVDYPDPRKAVREFSCEIIPSCLKVENNIGHGEFGEVCRGKLREQNGAEIYVAVKRMKGGVKDQFSFLQEASIMAQFSHPNVVQLKGVVTKSSPQMIVTEYMEHGSLDFFLKKKKGQLTVIQLIEMLKGIAKGMRYLSNMKYVHRDLAARNILVNSDLVCKVSDFGLSRTLENDPHATYTTQGGKIAIRWTAPECIRFRKFTSSSDVWSYGIVMWEVMSYGEKPYWDMTNQQVVETIEQGYRLPAPYECPMCLHRLMVECWAFNATQRPNMDAVYHRLDELMRQPAALSKVNLQVATTPTTPMTDDPKPFVPA
ncbi:ephrin type-A receptor 4-A-like [Clavelina lepadiformis]|uniref:ephrin type-A receptor 4-A-like n=1 Tax=Clavelina lepadiformis TaxID=159417 RepID=UPI004042D6C3